jgi:hypothetical protein
MTDEELRQLIVEWMKAKGGVATEEDFDCLTAILEEHFPEGPSNAILDDARKVLGLK